MTRPKDLYPRILLAAVLLASPLFDSSRARADGVGILTTSKSIPPATVALIDPETGTSTGGGSTDVKVAPGDIILFRIKFIPVPDSGLRGLGTYLTDYIPPNTQVVGVRIIDENGLTIPPLPPGIAPDDCGRPCNNYSSVPCATAPDCSGGTRSLQGGSIAQLHADTGVFYSTDPRTAKTPNDAFITLGNGILMNPPPRDADTVDDSLNTSSPYYAHNQWDWIQVQGFGQLQSASGNQGTGNTPYLYGSPVAGPDTFYQYEASENAGNVVFDDIQGPWQRVLYPGSTTGTGGPSDTKGGPLTRVDVPVATGWDVTPKNPLPAGTNAVRVALGEARIGEPVTLEIALKVLNTPLDPNQGKDVNCAELTGSQLSGASALDTPWPFYLPTPACVYLNLLFDLDVDKSLPAGIGDTLVYTIHGKNLSLNPQTNVVVKQKFPSTRIAFVSATNGGQLVTDCDGDGLDCVVWPTMDLQPSDEYTFQVTYTVGGWGQGTAPVYANYVSDQLPAPGYTTQAVAIIRNVTVVRADLTCTTQAASPGGTAHITGRIGNTGTASATYDTLTIFLPSGWSASSITLDGQALSCQDLTTNRPTCDLSLTFDPGVFRNLVFDVNVPGGTTTDLYPIGLQIWASQAGYGGSFETFWRDLTWVPVGAVRSDVPTVDCPIQVTDTQITGTTSEPDGTTIHVYFNGIERGTATANGGTWTFAGWQNTFGDLYNGLEVRASAEASGELESERSQACFVTSRPACLDGLDNDGDGLTDFPADPGCSGPTDGSEEDPPPPQCSDGLDNDGNGQIDFPQDPSCASPDDPTEDGSIACSNGVDDDGDGQTDFPNDPGCSSASDPDEIERAACQDFVDNDGDGLTDFPEDPGCVSAFDDDETDLTFPAEPIKARILLVFDTSGSMNWNSCNAIFTGGDGSNECPGNDVLCATCTTQTCEDGQPNDSRIYKVKSGISKAVAAYGSVDWALMRFHQKPMPFQCPTDNASLQSGGWQGAGAAPCGGGFNAGDLLVRFSPDNTKEILAWMDNRSDYSGTPPPGFDRELRATGTTPLAGSLQSAKEYLAQVQAQDQAAGCRPYRVILVTDGKETCGGDPVAAAADLLANGIPVYVVGFATTDQDIIDSLNAIAAAGGTNTAVFADDDVSLSSAIANIVSDSILSEVCNGADDDCDTLVDEDWPELGQPCNNGELGACYREGVYVCKADGSGTLCNAPAGTPSPEVCNNIDDDCNGLTDDGISCTPCTPSAEICNGQDDDCDGETDEPPLPGVGNSCGTDQGECRSGTYECVNGSMVCAGSVGPQPEQCNGLDDDCDGLTDGFAEECYEYPTGCVLGVGCEGICRTGTRTCTNGAWGACTGQVGPSTEVCNGLDDDCDGLTDEDWPELGQPCDNGLPGSCRTVGTYECLPDGSGVFCTAPPVLQTQEVCNGADDDCDGLTDEPEDLPPPVGEPCGGTTPPCTPGTYECVNGVVQCVGGSGGTEEVCNGLDDDCDGLTDEPPMPDTGQPCTDPGYEDIGDQGACEYGRTVCTPDGTIECDGYKGPQPEQCNGLDDDCDGVTDNEAECPNPEDLCWEGTCVPPCGSGEFPCAHGTICAEVADGRYCLPNPCDNVTCPEGTVPSPDAVAQTCDCQDPCVDVQCPEGLACYLGLCVDCFHPENPCPEGETCVRDEQSGYGKCVADPCVEVDCGEGAYCLDGDCCPAACDPPCAEGEYCDTRDCSATCKPDPCVGTDCPEGRVCRPESGRCVPDLCAGAQCGPGQTCDPTTGNCTEDPCAKVTCPEGQVCRVTSDLLPSCAQPPKPPATEVKVLATGPGGCACEASSPGPDPAPLLLVLLGLPLVRRRRRGERTR